MRPGTIFRSIHTGPGSVDHDGDDVAACAVHARARAASSSAGGRGTNLSFAKFTDGPKTKPATWRRQQNQWIRPTLLWRANPTTRLTFCPVPIGSTIFSGVMPFMTHTAAITSLTPNGGFFIDLTIVMSAGYNDSIRLDTRCPRAWKAFTHGLWTRV